MTTPGYMNAADNPDAANAAFAAATASSVDRPEIDAVPDGYIKLPGGLVIDGQIVREAEVHELTGAHEEAMARARLSPTPARFVSTLLQCGVATIGGHPATRELLLKLFVGDRDALLLGIRRATYGDDVEMEETKCPHCAERINLTVTLDDIPTVELSDPELDGSFKVELRRGEQALVRLPTGMDQEAILANPDQTIAERNTIMLSRCVVTITGLDGEVKQVAVQPSLVREGLSIPDRSTIIEQIRKRAPGPRLEDVSFTHELCGQEVPLPLEIGELFLGL